MAISRRNFLKKVGAGSLASLTSSSEAEQISNEKQEESQILDGKWEYDLAFHSLDISEQYLKHLIERKYTRPHQTYASNIDSGTRFIHLNTWSWLPGINRVKQQFIPLLEKARDSIDINDLVEIKKHNPNVIKDNADYPRYATHVKACISFRIKNLERYCKGLNSDTEGCGKEVEEEGRYAYIK